VAFEEGFQVEQEGGGRGRAGVGAGGEGVGQQAAQVQERAVLRRDPFGGDPGEQLGGEGGNADGVEGGQRAAQGGAGLLAQQRGGHQPPGHGGGHLVERDVGGEVVVPAVEPVLAGGTFAQLGGQVERAQQVGSLAGALGVGAGQPAAGVLGQAEGELPGEEVQRLGAGGRGDLVGLGGGRGEGVEHEEEVPERNLRPDDEPARGGDDHAGDPGGGQAVAVAPAGAGEVEAAAVVGEQEVDVGGRQGADARHALGEEDGAGHGGLPLRGAGLQPAFSAWQVANLPHGQRRVRRVIPAADLRPGVAGAAAGGA
jgi:hypothetical protein